jgi:cysteine desulfurase/selenocysteine lyase
MEGQQETHQAQVTESILDVDAVRKNFPLLTQHPQLRYLDNAATSQKPHHVIDSMTDCYRRYNAPVHRGLYKIADQASNKYEQAREKIANFIHAVDSRQIIFTRSATEAINMVAMMWARQRLQVGDEIWISRMEHHSNFLPWQRVCEQTGARLRLIELNADGSLNLGAAKDMYGPRTGLIAISHVSNVLGVVNPIKQIISKAKEKGIPVLIDAAQSVAHMALDINDLGCDFLALSAHKMYGPCGIGVLYVHQERLNELQPLLVGGGMVDHVCDTFPITGKSRAEGADNIWSPSPSRFEAGSPNLAGAVGFAAATDYLNQIGIEVVSKHVANLTQYALKGLCKVPGITIYGSANTTDRAGIISFNVADIHPHDLGQVMAENDVAIRVGHHCCQPLMRHLGVAATARVSFALYNQVSDIDAMIDSIKLARETFLI